MIKKLTHTQQSVADEILKLQQLSYKVEADLIGFADLPPLKESVEDVQNSPEDFYGCFSGHQLYGVISIQVANGALEICRLCVHLTQFRKGIAQQLLKYVEQQLFEYEEIRVSTGTDNHPAVLFYQRNGFYEVRQIRTVKEGLSLTFLNKRRKTADTVKLLENEVDMRWEK